MFLCKHPVELQQSLSFSLALVATIASESNSEWVSFNTASFELPTHYDELTAEIVDEGGGWEFDADGKSSVTLEGHAAVYLAILFACGGEFEIYFVSVPLMVCVSPAFVYSVKTIFSTKQPSYRSYPYA